MMTHEHVSIGNDIEYIQKPPQTGYYSEDNGQFVSTGDFARICTNWKCQQWRGNEPWVPLKVTNPRGFKVCPVCQPGQVK